MISALSLVDAEFQGKTIKPYAPDDRAQGLVKSQHNFSLEIHFNFDLILELYYHLGEPE